MRVLPIRTLAVPLILLPLLIAARLQAATFISIEPSPVSIPADGKSACQILITAQDETGTRVPDGTEVRLTTSAGDITPSVRTMDGRGIAILTAATAPQIAVVTASALGSSAGAQVEFTSSDAEEAPAIARAVRMHGGALAYCVDQDTVVGSSGVTIEYRGLTIKANSAQVRQIAGQIRAQGDVTIEKDSQSVTADMLALDTRTDRIRLMNLNDDRSLRTLDAKLQPVGEQNTAATPQAFTPLVNVDGATWIVCGRLVMIPGRRILFYKAAIYLGETRVFTMPYYSYDYQKRETLLQQVRYSSQEGMLMDLPFYYRVADSGAGALKLRYAASGTDMGSYYRPRKGASVGLQEDFALGVRGQGRLFWDSIGSGDQALEMNHHIEYGMGPSAGRLDLYSRYQPSSAYAKDMYNTSLNVMGALRNYTYTLSAYLGGGRILRPNYLDPDAPPDYVTQSNTTVRSVFRPQQPLMTRPFGALVPSLTLGYGNLSSSSAAGTSPRYYQSLGLGLNRTLAGDRSAALTLDGQAGVTLTTRGETGASLRLRPGFRKNWNGGSASLNYTLSLQRGVTDSVTGPAKHLLGGSLFVYGGAKWNANVYASYGLDSEQFNLFSGFSYNLPKGWRVRSSYDLFRYTYRVGDTTYHNQNSYLQVGIYHPIGPYEIGVAWSPDGQNYGIEKDKHIWLELGASGF